MGEEQVGRDEAELRRQLGRVTHELLRERDLSARLLRELSAQQDAITALYRNAWSDDAAVTTSAQATAAKRSVVARARSFGGRVRRRIARRAR